VDDGKVDHYIIRMAYIQFNSASSPYYYQYRKNALKSNEFNAEIHQGGSYEDREIVNTDLPDKIKNEIGEMHFYDRILATDHFLNGKSMREMSREYGINRSYISKDLKRIKQYLIEKYDEQFSIDFE
jgi:hypothetical protein